MSSRCCVKTVMHDCPQCYKTGDPLPLNITVLKTYIRLFFL